jgi:site-specific DNA recombinase
MALKPLRRKALLSISGSKRVARIRARNKVTSDARATIAAKAVGYTRVSTDDQAAHGFGLDVQERAVRAFAESQGYDLVEIITDPGVSGATKPAERPGFARVLEMAAADAISVLLVHKVDRLARDIRHAVTTVSELAEQHDVAFRSVAESVIDTSNPMGRTIFAIFAGMAENERHVITERTLGGRIQKASQGGYACGGVPYGYARDKEGGLVINEREARVVRRIVRSRKQRRMLKEIAAELNAEGIPSPRGGLWQTSTLSYLLSNPKYGGNVEFLFGEQHILRPGAHAAIV